MHRADHRILVGFTSPMSVPFVQPLAEALEEQGSQVVFAHGGGCGSGCVGRSCLSLAVERGVLGPFALLRSVMSARRDIITGEFGTVIAGSPAASLVLMVASRLARVPVRIYWVWGLRYETLRGGRRLAVLAAEVVTNRASTHVLAVSESVRRALADVRLTRPAHVIGHGSTHGVVAPRSEPQHVPSPSRPVSERRLTLGFLGRLAADKGFDDLVAVVEHLRGTDTAVRAVIAGETDPADPAEADLVELRNDDTYRMLGQTTDIDRFFGSIDALVLPSAREGLPNVCLEAAVRGVPVIAYDATGTRDAVERDVTGWLVEPHRPDLLATTLLDLHEGRLRYDPHGARRWALSRFEQQRVLELHTAQLGRWMTDRTARR